MKILPVRFTAGVLSLAVLVLPAAAAKRNGPINDKQLDSRSLMQKSHQRSDAEKDARRMDKEVRRSDAEEKRAAELLKKFDANHDGVLDEKEKAAMDAALKKQQEKRDNR